MLRSFCEHLQKLKVGFWNCRGGRQDFSGFTWTCMHVFCSHLPWYSSFTLQISKTYLRAYAIKGYWRMAHAFLLFAACSVPVAPLHSEACSPGRQGTGFGRQSCALIFHLWFCSVWGLSLTFSVFFFFFLTHICSPKQPHRALYSSADPSEEYSPCITDKKLIRE